jgi:amino acid transporter
MNESVKNEMSVVVDSDASDLEKFGYKQQLKRSMGSFSSFAISFSLISVITGVFANFAFGVQQVGGTLVWSWLLVGVGQFLVALVMADLSNHFPISGYGYQWSSRLTNSHIGYFVAWALLMQFITGFPGVSQALVTTVFDLSQGATGEWEITLFTVVVITAIMLIHIFGIRLVTIVNEIGVWAEIIGVIVIIGLLWGLWIFAGEMDVSNLFDSRNTGTGSNAGFSAFALSLLVGAWCLTGFEAAADLAEETHTPKKTIPKAIIGSHLAATVFGFLMIAGLIISVSNIELLQESNNPILFVLEQKMGPTLIKIIIVIVILSIFACGLASMATASRLIYSMARDNMLPFSSVLSKVDPKYNTPKNATLFVWALGCIFVLLVRQLVIINSISAVAGYMGYCGILISTLITKKKSVNISGFSLGKWQKPIQGIALLWTASVVAALTIPETHVEGMDETHLPAKSTLVAFLIGLSIYAFIIRRRIKKGTAGPPVNQKINR